MEIEAATIADAWSNVLRVFSETPPARSNYRHGSAFDIPGLTIWVDGIADKTLPEGFQYPELVHDYQSRLFGEQQKESLFHQRITTAKGSGRRARDQIESIFLLLREDPGSRAAVFSVWDPSVDIESDFPISPVGGAFRIVNGRLILFVTARSADVWVGLVPELLAFARYAETMAWRLGLTKAILCYHAWSAHMYETDLLAYTNGLV